MPKAVSMISLMIHCQCYEKALPDFNQFHEGDVSIEPTEADYLRMLELLNILRINILS